MNSSFHFKSYKNAHVGRVWCEGSSEFKSASPFAVAILNFLHLKICVLSFSMQVPPRLNKDGTRCVMENS